MRFPVRVILVSWFIYFCITFINSLKSLLNFCYIIFLSVMLLFYFYCEYYIYVIYFFYYFYYLRHRQCLISGIFSFMVSLICSYYWYMKNILFFIILVISFIGGILYLVSLYCIVPQAKHYFFFFYSAFRVENFLDEITQNLCYRFII